MFRNQNIPSYDVDDVDYASFSHLLDKIVSCAKENFINADNLWIDVLYAEELELFGLTPVNSLYNITSTNGQGNITYWRNAAVYDFMDVKYIVGNHKIGEIRTRFEIDIFERKNMELLTIGRVKQSFLQDYWRGDVSDILQEIAKIELGIKIETLCLEKGIRL